IAEDPERTWAQTGDHAVYQLNQYLDWGVAGPPDTIPRLENRDQVIETGGYVLWDAATAISELTALLRGTPQIEDVHFFAQLPGESVESGSERAEYIAKKVIPEVRAQLSSR